MNRSIILFALTLSAALAGCQAATETTDTADGRTFRHNGLHFAVTVPPDWTIEPLAGTVALEIRGPKGAGRGQPMAHVFTREEAGKVHLADDVAQLDDLMKHDQLFQLE